MRADLRTAAAVAAFLVTPAVAGAQDSYANAPFRDTPVQLAQAAALDRIAAFAKALAAAGPLAEADADGDDQAEGEDEEGGPLDDFALVRGSLAEKAPEVGQRLAGAIGAMVEGGGEATEAAAEVPALVEAARDKLLLAEAVAAPHFGAALMSSLLLDEGGVAEGYEGAVDGRALAYSTSYFALERVKALWEGIAPAASPEQVADVGEMLTMLDALFPGGKRPEALSADPEQAEAPAQQLVGLLEAVTDADLYPGRDLPGAADRVRDIVVAGCEALDDGDADVGLETLTIAATYYGSTLADTLVVMAPEAGDAIAENLESVQESEPGEAVEACPPLLDALAAGRKALGP